MLPHGRESSSPLHVGAPCSSRRPLLFLRVPRGHYSLNGTPPHEGLLAHNDMFCNEPIHSGRKLKRFALSLPLCPYLSVSYSIWYALISPLSVSRAGAMARCLCLGQSQQLQKIQVSHVWIRGDALIHATFQGPWC